MASSGSPALGSGSPALVGQRAVHWLPACATSRAAEAVGSTSGQPCDEGMGLLSKIKALGSLTTKRKYSKQELAFIEEARRALIDWGVACETAGPAEVEALYLLEQRKVRSQLRVERCGS